MRITQLTAQSLRGIPAAWPAVDFREGGLIIYGPNGVGKSSLIDALEFALSGRSTLYAAGRQGVNWAAGAPHVRGGQMKVSAVLTEAGQEYVLTPGEPPPAAISGWCDLAAKSGFVLRRHMLLNFVDAEPRHRYDRLEPFLNLGPFLAFETALQHAASQAELGVTTTETQLRTKEQVIRAVFKVAPDGTVDEAAVLNAINSVLAEANMAAIGSLAEVATIKESIEVELGGSAVDTRLSTLHALRGQAQRLAVAIDLKALMDQVETRAATLEAELTARVGPVITDFLIRGRDLLAELSASECPLCEQGVDRDTLIARLNERISADERITAARNALNSAVDAMVLPARALANAMHQFIGEWGKCFQAKLPDGYDATARLLDEIIAPRTTLITSAEAADLGARLSATVVSHQPIIDDIDAAIAEAGGGERRSRLLSAKEMLGSASKDWQEYQSLTLGAREARSRSGMAARVHGHAVEARKTTVQNLLDDVAGVANSFYDILHPGEDIANSKLMIRPTEVGSVNLFSSFYGREAPPLLYYSESHLDTLGLCYFLALRRREADENPDFKMLLLDDIIHSVDARHRSRFVTLLKDHFSDHQIVITTHDSIFYQLLKQAFGSNKYAYLALTGWDIERGPLRGDPAIDLDRIVDPELRASKSAEELAGAGGRLLEWMLREATEALEVAIPARFKGKHTIGTMWPPFAKKLRGQKHFAAAHPTLADDVEQTGWVRNEVGAHYNDPASPVDPDEVRNHAAHLASLHAALTCGHCSGFLRKHGDHDWRCPCGRTAYPPVEKAAQASTAAAPN